MYFFIWTQPPAKCCCKKSKHKGFQPFLPDRNKFCFPDRAAKNCREWLSIASEPATEICCARLGFSNWFPVRNVPGCFSTGVCRTRLFSENCWWLIRQTRTTATWLTQREPLGCGALNLMNKQYLKSPQSCYHAPSAASAQRRVMCLMCLIVCDLT